MIPLQDLNPTRRAPIVTVVLIAMNVAVFLFVQQAQSGTDRIETPDGIFEVEASTGFTLEYAAIPCEVVTAEPLSTDELVATFVQGDDAACTRDDTSSPLYPGKHVWLALILSMFLHGGWLHLGGNMLFLWIFGNNVEDHLGPLKYIGFYLLGGLVAGGAHIAAQPSSTIPVVGASGAIAAVMGAYLVWYPNARIRTLIFIFYREITAKWLLLTWLVLQFFMDPRSGVAWVAHVGGFVFGVLVGLGVGRPPPRLRPLMPVWEPPGAQW